jgi:hypothetical protein
MCQNWYSVIGQLLDVIGSSRSPSSGTINTNATTTNEWTNLKKHMSELQPSY